VKTKAPTLISRVRISLPHKIRDLLQATQQNNDRSKLSAHRPVYISLLSHQGLTMLKTEKDAGCRIFFSQKFNIQLFEQLDGSIMVPLGRSQMNLITQRLYQQLKFHVSNRG